VSVETKVEARSLRSAAIGRSASSWRRAQHWSPIGLSNLLWIKPMVDEHYLVALAIVQCLSRSLHSRPTSSRFPDPKATSSASFENSRLISADYAPTGCIAVVGSKSAKSHRSTPSSASRCSASAATFWLATSLQTVVWSKATKATAPSRQLVRRDGRPGIIVVNRAKYALSKFIRTYGQRCSTIAPTGVPGWAPGAQERRHPRGD